jgi:hypothetical protein
MEISFALGFTLMALAYMGLFFILRIDLQKWWRIKYSNNKKNKDKKL